MNNVVSLLVAFLNVVLWLTEWHFIIGFEWLRHASLLWFPIVLFIVFSIIQYVSELVENAGDNQQTMRREFNVGEHFKTIVNIASSVILAISILVSLHTVINEKMDIDLKKFFLYSAMVSFLWIFFGVYCSFSPDCEKRVLSARLSVRLKSTALIHALGWASVCVSSLMMMLARIYDRH